MYYYRARNYDPMEERFISKDPISFSGGDVNLYGYSGNRPINYRDPFGLKDDSCCKGVILERIREVEAILAKLTNNKLPGAGTNGMVEYGHTACFFGPHKQVSPHVNPCLRNCTERHENVHVSQCNNDGFWKFKHIFYPNNDVKYEKEAYKEELNCLYNAFLSSH